MAFVYRSLATSIDTPQTLSIALPHQCNRIDQILTDCARLRWFQLFCFTQMSWLFGRLCRGRCVFRYLRLSHHIDHSSGNGRRRFSIIGFYERRARRILPALFVVMAACLPLSAMLLFPEQYKSFATSLIAAALFVASFHFRMESGYFDLAATEKPLLHTWSLSVEEIFYVFFPLLLLFMARRQNRTILIVLCLFAALSFLASVAALANNPVSRTAFFLPPCVLGNCWPGVCWFFSIRNGNCRQHCCRWQPLSGWPSSFGRWSPTRKIQCFQAWPPFYLA